MCPGALNKTECIKWQDDNTEYTICDTQTKKENEKENIIDFRLICEDIKYIPDNKSCCNISYFRTF